MNNSFVTSRTTVLEKCKDFKRYDVANFAAIFKKNKDLFKEFTDDESLELSAAGKQYLAETILEMSS